MPFPIMPILKKVTDIIPRDGLVAEYLFSGNADDTSDGGNDATVINATLTTDRKSASNKAYHFNGTTARMTTGFLPDITKSISISFWFTTENISKNQDINLAWKQGTARQTWRFIINQIVGNKLTFRTRSNTDTNFDVNATNILSINTWYHVVGIIERQASDFDIHLYLDNVFQSTTNSDVHLDADTPAAPLSMGEWNPALGTLYFQGKLDDLRIYNRVLTSDERTVLFNE